MNMVINLGSVGDARPITWPVADRGWLTQGRTAEIGTPIIASQNGEQDAQILHDQP